MWSFLKKFFQPQDQAFNPACSFRVSGVTRWKLRRYLAALPGVTITKRPRLLASSVTPLLEFEFRGLAFLVDHGGDTGGDGLWVTPVDELPHPDELRELCEHVAKAISSS